MWHLVTALSHQALFIGVMVIPLDLATHAFETKIGSLEWENLQEQARASVSYCHEREGF